MSFSCALCSRVRKIKQSEFTTVDSVDVEEKIKQAFEHIEGIPVSNRLLNQQVHRKCYGKYHRHYLQVCEKKQPLTEISNCVTNDRLPLVDRTNYRLSPSPNKPSFSSSEANESLFISSSPIQPSFISSSPIQPSFIPSALNKSLSISLSSIEHICQTELSEIRVCVSF
jgi:hypothetical protein